MVPMRNRCGRRLTRLAAQYLDTHSRSTWMQCLDTHLCSKKKEFWAPIFPHFFTHSSDSAPQTIFGDEERKGNKRVECIQWIRLVGLLPAGVENVLETMPKAVGRVEEKCRSAEEEAPGCCVRPFEVVGIQRRCAP